MSNYGRFIRLGILILALAGTLACNTVTSRLAKPTSTPTELPRPAATSVKTPRPAVTLAKTPRPAATLEATLPSIETQPASTTPAGSDALAGARIKIIYIPERQADAQEAQSRLEALGADIIMLQVDKGGIETHIGRVYYIGDNNYDLAAQVAAEVADIETVEPTLQTEAPDMGQQINLWIAGSPTIGVLPTAAPTTVAPTVAPGADGLSGLRIKIIYIAAREADAQEAQARLEALGVDVVMLRTSDLGNADHIGKLYYVKGYYDQAVVVAALVADLETVKPTVLPIAPDVGQQLNLWIAASK